MPRTQRFEGTSLEDLLEDVRDQFGANVAIAEANKIRKGGVGGFFAKELFEVVVEVEEDTASTEAGGTTTTMSPPRSLLDLVDAVDDVPPTLDRRQSSRAGLDDPQDRQSIAPDALASAATIRDLLAKTDDAPLPDERTEDGVAGLLSRMAGRNQQPVQQAPAPANAMSTDGAAFGDVLRRIAASTRTDQPIDDAPTVFDDGEDEPFRPYAVTLPAHQTPTVSAPPAASEHTPADVTSPKLANAAEVVDSPGRAMATDPVGSVVAAPRGMRVRPDAHHAPVVAIDADALGRLGVPEQYRRSMATNRDRIGSLLELAQSFPTAPPLPDHPGAVIAVVGDRVAMMRAITWVQEGLGLSPEHLMLASPTDRGVFPEERRLCSAEDAGTRRQGWRRRSRPTLVAIDQPVGLQATAWTRHVLDALDLQAVWGVTDAGRKPEDITLWAERIGGVDALAVDGTIDTASPASVLTTGIPVALLDGASATPARWAAVLDDRLAA